MGSHVSCCATHLLSETEAKTLLHVLEERTNIPIAIFSLDIFACVKHLWIFSLTSQTSDREPASRHTSSLYATVLNSPLCLWYPSWHQFSSLGPKTALHCKMQQKLKRNKRTKTDKLEDSLIISQYLVKWVISTHFRLTAFSSWVRVKQATSMSVTDANKHDPHKLFWLSWN